MEKILADIRNERAYQIKQWGDDFDKKNTANDWIAYIVKYTARAVTMPWDPRAFRAGLIKVATLCVAAIEQLDENNGDLLAKRHYD